MGGNIHTITIETPSIQDDFNKLVERAISLYGDSDYNGSISTTKLKKNIVNFDLHNIKYSSSIQKKFNKMNLVDIVNRWGLEKRQTLAINLGIIDYVGMTVASTKINTRPARKKGVTTLKEFAVKNSKNSVTLYFSTLTDARKGIKEHLLLSEDPSAKYTIHQLRSDNSMFLVEELSLQKDGTRAKSKRKNKTKVYFPCYHYELVVFACE